jgi:histidine phosphatase superfamily protein (branch 2)
MHRSRLLIVVAAMIALAACQSSGPKKTGDSVDVVPSGTHREIPTNLSTLTPYPGPSKKTTLKAPAGFEPVFAENVARHGARSLTNGGAVDDAIGLWEKAKREGALTPAGRHFGPDARALRTAMEKDGYGRLSALGEQEMQDLGRREGERLSAMFDTAVAGGATRVDILDSGSGRAKESAQNFSAGLAAADPDLVPEPSESNEKMLHFDTEDHAYKHYLNGKDWTPGWYAVRQRAHIDEEAVATLKHLYKPDFVAGIDNPLYQANAVYDLYRSGPSMSRDVNVDTSRFMDQKAADAYAYVDDARYFYSRGPGVQGDDRSYRAASILLDDFFKVIDDRLKGRGPHPHAAVYRFSHAEEIAPFAALLGLPGADEPAKPGQTYTHENNDFRISSVTPLSGNIEWTVWSKGDTTIVSIYHDEVPTTVGRDCRPYQGTKMFYELDELKSCLGATG